MSLDDYYSKALALYESANDKLLETFNLIANDYSLLSIMLIAFWTVVILILLVSLNIYRKVVKKPEPLITNDNNNNVDDHHLSNNHIQHTATTSTAKNNISRGNLEEKLSINEQIQRSKTNNLTNEKPTTTESLLESSENKFILWMNNAVEWFNESTTNETFVNEMTNIWIDSLNDKSKKLIYENGIFLEFISLEQNSRTKLSQVEDAEEIDKNIVTTMKAACDNLIMQVRVAPNASANANQSAIYHVILEKFQTLLKVICICKDSLVIIRPVEKPETKAQIEGPILGSKNKFPPDVIINAVLNVLTQTTVNFNFSKAKDFPKIDPDLVQNIKIPDANKQSHLERKLLLKVVQACDLKNLNLNETDPNNQLYCVIEVDEPFQTIKTSPVRGNLEAPVWDQHFMIPLNERSNEILFELFAKTNIKNATDNRLNNDVILGNAIINISELVLNPSQVQTLRLQSSFDKKDIGWLVVEFLLMEHKTSTATSGSGIQTNNEDNTLINYENTNHNFDETNHNDLFIRQPNFPIQSNINQPQYHHLANNQQSTLTDKQENIINEPAIERKLSQEDAYRGKTPVNNSTLPPNEPFDSRPLEKRFSNPEAVPSNKKSLVRSIKKRFSFNKRSKSVDRQINRSKSPAFNDSEYEYEKSRSVPGSREPSMPMETINNNGKLESVGNLSQMSTRTFMHEDSKLIIECQEKGGTRYYVMPNNVLDKKEKFPRKGTKIHLFKNHMFVSRHVPSSKLCPICSKKFTFTFGKQAYQCQDCKLICHKPCHVNITTECFSNRIHSLPLIYLDHADTKQATLSNNIKIPQLKITDEEYNYD